jgi:integrase
LGLDYPPDSDPATGEPKVIKNGLADLWGARPVVEIDHHLIFETVSEAGKRGIPGFKRRNRGNSDARKRALHAALSVFFAWLKRERKITSNPCADIDRAGPPAARDHVLKADEIRWFWQAADSIGEPFGSIFKLLLLTGARLREVAGMRYDELHENGASWHLPGNRTKKHLPHVVPLSPAAQAIIAAASARQPIIFSTTGLSPPSGWSRAKRRLDAAMAGIATNDRGADVKIAFRLHDLRRTAATGMAEIGIAPHIVEACLNHLSGARAGVAGTYNRAAYAAEKKVALERWAAHVSGIVNGTTGKVVPLHKTGAS